MTRIADNKKATFNYFIEERFEAGIVLQGWEVKAIRSGRALINEAYVIVRNAELFLLNFHITPLISASTHIKPEAGRTRKLLMHAAEIEKLIGKVERAGYALVPLDLHWTRGNVKVTIGLAKGKQQHDKRATEKEKDWKREKAALMKHKQR